MKKTFLFITLFMMSFVQNSALADEAKAKSMEELSKEIANPLAQIWNLSFQYSYTNIDGDLVDGSEYIQTGLFQPVLPVPIGDKYTAFARPVITYIEGPSEVGITGGTPADPLGHGTERSSDFGDIILPIGAGVANPLGWSWGAGLTFIFPTSNNDLLGSHQYQAGPTALALWANEDWMIGGHLQHWWGIADDGDSDSNPIIRVAHDKNLNHTNLQYFIIRHLPNAWQLRASPNVTVDWEADSDNKLTLPIAIGIGKMFKIGPMPVMLVAEYQYSVIAPDNIGRESSIMLQANFIIKNPFGDL
ncbi:MAG TPA: hypothetical protein EYG88_00365 [Desulfocapsa sulfexigens]|nr:hypothetical protein [Desulfocapsa sulfexigens]